MLNNLSVIGLNHISSSVDLREHIAFTKDNIEEGIKQFNQLSGVDSGFILSTCNRSEIYYLGDAEANEVINWLANFHHLQPNKLSNIRGCSYHYRGKDTLAHLIKVSSGLDSMALGETQVLGQIKDTYKHAKEKGYINNKIDALMQFVFAVAKKVRSDTNIGKNSVTLASTAVSVADRIMDGIKDKNVMVVGAGNNARLVIEHLSAKEVKKIYIANRTYSKASQLAKKYNGEAIPTIDIAKCLSQVDCLFTSTSSPTILVGKGMVEDAVNKWGRKPMFISDMSLPHDVEDSVVDINQVYLYKLGDLETLLKENYSLKQQAAQKAEKIIEQEIKSYISEKSNSGEDLKLYRGKIDKIKQQELTKIIDSSMDNNTKQKLIQLADSLAAKISHGPSTMIKDMHSEEDQKSINHMRKNLLEGKK